MNMLSFSLKKPDLNLYWIVAALIANGFVYMWFSQDMQTLGFVLLMNMAIVLARCVWMLETYWLLKDKDEAQYYERLPSSLLKTIDSNDRLARGFKSLHTIDRATMFILVCFLLYLSWITLSTLYPISPGSYLIWLAGAEGILNSLNGFADIHLPSLQKDRFYLHIGALLSTAGFFWVVRSVVSHANSKITYAIVMTGIFVVLIISQISLYGFANGEVFIPYEWRGAGAGFAQISGIFDISGGRLSSNQTRLLEFGTAAQIFLNACVLIIVITFFKSLFNPRRSRLAVFIGVGVLLALGYLDHFSINSPALWGIWMSGWASLSAWFLIACPNTLKSYRIHQA